MKQISRQIPPYKHCAILDDEFDLDDEFETAIIESIARCGTIDIHPDGWGIHDGLFAKSDAAVPIYNAPGRSVRQYRTSNRQAQLDFELVAIQQRNREEEKERFDWAFSQLCGFPHCINRRNIISEAAIEFAQFGHTDAGDRDITPELWIWRRSRFMAGFE